MGSDAEREADQQLEAAIQNSLRVYGYEGLLMEWVLVTAGHIPPEAADEQACTEVGLLVATDSPMHRTLGLLRYALAREEHNILQRED